MHPATIHNPTRASLIHTHILKFSTQPPFMVVMVMVVVVMVVMVIQKYTFVYYICSTFSLCGQVVEGRSRGRGTTNNDL